jgi:ankyrin repeat protein
MADLWQSAKVGDVARLEKLLDRGIPPNRTRWSGITALHRACAEGHMSCVILLLARGANVDQRCTMGWYTAIHLACRYGFKEVAEKLLDAGATWKIEDKVRSPAIL